MRTTAALLLSAVAACTSQGSEAAERREDTSGRRDSVAGVAAASMNDASALGLLRMTHSADSALGALGAARGSTTEVKEFGRMILREHASLVREAGGVARDLGIAMEAPRVPPDDAPAGTLDAVMAVPAGQGWDMAYLDYAIAMHDAAIENTARALAATRRPEVRAYIERSVPILQKHLDRAKTLQQRFANVPAATKTPSTKTP
jgi:putative membrane protein